MVITPGGSFGKHSKNRLLILASLTVIIYQGPKAVMHFTKERLTQPERSEKQMPCVVRTSGAKSAPRSLRAVCWTRIESQSSTRFRP